jgi:tripartite-type tricarboxylate transporter receptor subunit TctC
MKKIKYILYSLVLFSINCFAEINIVVPTTAGGSYDQVARQFSKFVTKELGTPVIVSNISGAGGLIGMRKVENDPPNTLMLSSSALYIILNEESIPLERFKYVSIIGESPLFLAVSKNKGLTCRDLRDRSNHFFVGTSGKGGVAGQPLAMIQKKYSNFTEVPYRSAYASTVDIISGQIDMTFISGLYSNRPDFELLANTSDVPYNNIPTLKTCMGVNETVLTQFILSANSNTDDTFIKQLNNLAIKFTADPDINRYLKEQGIIPKTKSIELTNKEVKLEYEKWKKITR